MKIIRSVVFPSFLLMCLTVGLVSTNANAAVPVRIDVVSPGAGNSSTSTAVAVTPEGIPSVVYLNATGNLMYARYNHPNWTTEIVGSGNEYEKVSLSLDSQGNPVVAAGLFQNIFVYVKNGSNWDIVHRGSDASWEATVRHDPADNIHVAYLQWPLGAPRIVYATNKTGDWVAEDVDYYTETPNSGYRQVAFDLNQTGQPGIAWRDEFGHLQYSWKVNEWNTEQVTSQNASNISLAIGVGSIPHICFFNSDNQNPVYAVGPVFNWSTTDLDPGQFVGYDSSIAVDNNDQPHISYFDDGTDHITYRYFSGGIWYGQIIESPGAVGWSTSIALDAYDNVHFSYQDQSDGEIHYAASQDCNDNGVDDLVDIANGLLDDCDNNGIADDCEIAMGFTDDCNSNGVPDECDTDCNNNTVPDDCDISAGTSTDCNSNGVPDECEPDCNGNGIADECDIDGEFSLDCNRNDIPDECDFANGTALDCNDNGIPDECDIRNGSYADCDRNGVPDECDFASGEPVDCNANLEIDLCEVSDTVHVGGSEYGQFGSSFASGDFNGDGYTDLAVGQPAWSGERGRVQVFYGGDPMDTFADEVWGPTTTHVDYGFSLAAGNIDGDAYDDLVIGSPGYNLEDGVVFIFRGTAQADLTYEAAKGAPFQDMRFGTSVALADINGDGQQDIIVGAPERTTNNEPGYVYVYSGSNPDGDPIETWMATANNDGFGFAVANAGDVDDNGLDDVIVGAVGGSTTGDVGYARIFLSRLEGSTDGPVLSTGAVSDLFGHAVSGAGDLNGDGIDDFIVSAPRSGIPGNIPGRAFLYHGSTSVDGMFDLTFVGVEHLANLGSAVSRTGDINDDGYDDLVIGADHVFDGGDFSWANLYFGGPHLDAQPDQRIISDHRGYGMGQAVGPGGDTNGDGIQEILVGHPSYSSAEFFEGRVSIVQLSLPDFGDCNGNGVVDMCDISSGSSADSDMDGIPDECGDVSVVVSPEIPARTKLLGAFPTPFNPRTELRFEMAQTAGVDLRVFDMSGRLIRTLASGEVFSSGRHAVVWQGRDDADRAVASGVYYFRLSTEDYTETMKMLLIK